MKIKDIAIIGMFSAILVAVQYSLAFLPNIELISLLIIIFTLILHKKTLYIITVFIILEGFLFGIGLWWINYLYIWFVLYLLVTLFPKESTSLQWAIISGGYGLSFGALCSIPYFFMGLAGGTIRSGLQSAFAYWIAGIPFDIAHGIANFVVVLLLFKPIYKIIDQLARRGSNIVTH
ncbi:hypothetical protein [Anaerocolumna sp. MB42-C2]|uniref:hypothetical protein n=1 Tax=Anaerocolumna sp. MB42-C2 TaxID=3070997 RepID=UPI0027E07661|nr:hypothetical protein [Anaerocolumna sp. MB42-C2]WMJ89565.1 hypothetical protein RBU59_08570 [Anaerocolumna sp. MB42-C2]